MKWQNQTFYSRLKKSIEWFVYRNLTDPSSLAAFALPCFFFSLSSYSTRMPFCTPKSTLPRALASSSTLIASYLSGALPARFIFRPLFFSRQMQSMKDFPWWYLWRRGKWSVIPYFFSPFFVVNFQISIHFSIITYLLLARRIDWSRFSLFCSPLNEPFFSIDVRLFYCCILFLKYKFFYCYTFSYFAWSENSPSLSLVLAQKWREWIFLIMDFVFVKFEI